MGADNIQLCSLRGSDVMIYMCTADDTTGTFCFYTCSAGTCAYNHIHVFFVNLSRLPASSICLACFQSSPLMVMVVKHLLKKKALLCFRRERKNTHKNRGDEVKEKSPINSGNGTCGAGLCFPNIPADWSGWEKGCETVGEGWVYADGGGLRGNEWEQTETEGVGGVKCRERDRLWRKHGEGE